MTATIVSPLRHRAPHTANISPSSQELALLSAILSDLCDRRVAITPTHLPLTVACIWTGDERADHIGYNQYWPGSVIAPITHAAAHLGLRHCGIVRDGGQFGCALLADQKATTRDQIQASLPNPGTVPGRLFSDYEELLAERFAAVHVGGLRQPAAPRELGRYACFG